MASDRSKRGTGEEEPPEDACFEELLRHYVNRLIAGESTDFQKVRRRHPDSAEQLVEDLEIFSEMGPPGPGGSRNSISTLGGYKLVRQIGRGGMGVVYEAWDPTVERKVVLKMLPGGLLADLRATARFQREAKAAGRLKHPNVISVYGMGVDENIPYYAMELAEGETLAQILSRIRRKAAGADSSAEEVRSDTGPFDAETLTPASCYGIAEAFAGAAEGLQNAHDSGVIHRDIKPSNLLFDSQGRLRILDFGLARLAGVESVTQSGDFLGTPLYMSPEQAAGSKAPVDQRTDVYSLGATLYEMLTRRPPFQGKNQRDTLARIAEGELTEPRKWNPRIPRDLQTILMKCLEKEPRHRYGTAGALAEDLRRFVKGDPIEARPRSRLDRLAHRLRIHWVAIAVAAALGILVALIGVLLVRRQIDRHRLLLSEYGPSVSRAVQKMQFGQLTTRLGNERTRRFDPAEFFVLNAEGPSTSVTFQDPVREAAAELAEVARALPHKPDAWYHLARCRLLLGDVNGALENLDRSHSCGGGFAPALLLKAAVLERRGEIPNAGALRAEAERTAESAWAKKIISAHRAVQEARWNEAVKAYKELVELERENGEVYIGSSVETRLARGAALMRTGELVAAERDFAVCTERWPDALDPVLLLGESYCLEGKKNEAQKCFLQFYRHTSYEDLAALGIAVRYFHLMDFEAGLSWANRIKNQLLRERTRIPFLCRLGRSAEAVLCGEEAIARSPGDPVLLANTAEACFNQGDTQGAAKLALRAKEANPQHVRTRHGLGSLYLEALESLRKLAERDPLHPEPVCRLAELLRPEGKAAAAGKVLGDCLGRFPDRSDFGNLWFETAAGLDLSAGEILRRISEGNSDSPESYLSDVSWVLKRLEARKPLRINCGGDGFGNEDGLWGGDRFYLSGQSRREELGPGYPQQDPYRTYRRFCHKGCLSGKYSVPLLNGVYRVTLHFAERRFLKAGTRVFDVHLEGEEKLPAYEPLAGGFAHPTKESFRVEITDGFLDLELMPRAGSAFICGLEISQWD